MKKTLIMLATVALMAAGCTSRSYVNRVPSRNNNPYGRYERRDGDRRYGDRYDHDRRDRDDRRW